MDMTKEILEHIAELETDVKAKDLIIADLEQQLTLSNAQLSQMMADRSFDSPVLQ